MNSNHSRILSASFIGHAATLLALLACLAARPLLATDEPKLGEKAKEAMRETSAAIAEAENAAASQAKDLWQRVDAARLKNRTTDELAAWIIMGVLVGGVAGTMTNLRSSGAGRFGRLLLGLAGACLGGIIVHVGRFDFNWGFVVIRYEELFFSFLGAVFLIVAGKLLRSRMKKKEPVK